jgi:hypothetical protein
MINWRQPLVTALVLFSALTGVVGCTATSDDEAGNSPTTNEPTTTEPTEPPSDEPTIPEPPQPSQGKPALEIANAPIGGNVRADGIYQCAEVNWLGRNPIPAGTAIRTGVVHLDPDGIFTLDQNGCRPDDRPCINVDWQEQNFQPCYVGVRQIASGTEDEPVTLIVAAVAVCATLADCTSLVGEQQGSQITFIPAELTSPTESPTASPSDG